MVYEPLVYEQQHSRIAGIPFTDIWQKDKIFMKVSNSLFRLTALYILYSKDGHEVRILIKRRVWV